MGTSVKNVAVFAWQKRVKRKVRREEKRREEKRREERLTRVTGSQSESKAANASRKKSEIGKERRGVKN